MVVVSNNPENETVALAQEVRESVEDDKSPPKEQAKVDTNLKQLSRPLTMEAYKNITGSMRAEPLQIDCPSIACHLLSTAINLQNMPLVNECIKNLDEHMTRDTVLMIYGHLAKCKIPSPNRDDNDFAPSAPPIIENENQRGTDWVHKLVDNLRHNCLLVLDKEADYILRQKEIIDLTYGDLVKLLERDTLEVSNEMLVYCAVYNWGMAECTRMTLNTQHLQEVLRQLRYAPRYGLMSEKQFNRKRIDDVRGPTKSGILDEEEWRQIRFYLRQKAKNLPVQELDYKMSKPRTVGTEKPEILSCKTSSRHETYTSCVRIRHGSYSGKNTWDRCLYNILACWSYLFD